MLKFSKSIYKARISFTNYSLFSNKRKCCIYIYRFLVGFLFCFFDYNLFFFFLQVFKPNKALSLVQNQENVFLCEVAWVHAVFTIKYYNHRCMQQKSAADINHLHSLIWI